MIFIILLLSDFRRFLGRPKNGDDTIILRWPGIMSGQRSMGDG